MSNGASYPKPDNERVTRNPVFDWVTLPERNEKKAPPLPPCPTPMSSGTSVPTPRPWSKEARAAWKKVWATPQSTQWTDDMFSTVETWLHLYEAIHLGRYNFVPSLGKVEDKLGLNPKAMLQLRWRYHPNTEQGERVNRNDRRPLAPVSDLPARRRTDPRDNTEK